tara:strand:+ start:132 stop:581 length:450 start_codon:yes stop_codon:yes gene_type:complete
MKLFKNILTKKEQKDLLKFLKSEVRVLGDTFPGLQTESNLHFNPNPALNTLLKKVKKYHKNYRIIKCWGLKTTGDFICWHQHDVDLSMVYYLKNKSKIGTMFQKEKTSVLITECEENSLSLFNGREIHSPPCHLPEERYVVTFDLINDK